MLYIRVIKNGIIQYISHTKDSSNMIAVENYPPDLLLDQMKYLYVGNQFINNPDYDNQKSS